MGITSPWASTSIPASRLSRDQNLINSGGNGGKRDNALCWMLASPLLNALMHEALHLSQIRRVNLHRQPIRITPFCLIIFDDLYDVTAAYQYFCLMVKPILQSEEYWDTSRKTRHGYALLLDWILERGDALLASLEHRVRTRDQAT